MNGSNRLVSMTCDAREKFPRLSGLSAPQQRSLVRSVKYCAIDWIRAGQRDASIVRDHCLTRVQSRKDFGVILEIVGIAVLTALVEWIIRKVLDMLAET